MTTTIADLDNAVLLGKNRWMKFQQEFAKKFFAPYLQTGSGVMMDAIDPNAKAALERVAPEAMQRLKEKYGKKGDQDDRPK
jgi:hypothetical protein